MNVYEKLSNAVAANVYVILRNGEYVGRIISKPSTSGMTLTAYVHWLGTRMVSARVGGGGYDRESAAIVKCAEMQIAQRENMGDHEIEFWYALARDNGRVASHNLQDVGFTVIQPV